MGINPPPKISPLQSPFPFPDTPMMIHTIDNMDQPTLPTENKVERDPDDKTGRPHFDSDLFINPFKSKVKRRYIDIIISQSDFLKDLDKREEKAIGKDKNRFSAILNGCPERQESYLNSGTLIGALVFRALSEMFRERENRDIIKLDFVRVTITLVGAVLGNSYFQRKSEDKHRILEKEYYSKAYSAIEQARLQRIDEKIKKISKKIRELKTNPEENKIEIADLGKIVGNFKDRILSA